MKTWFALTVLAGLLLLAAAGCGGDAGGGGGSGSAGGGSAGPRAYPYTIVATTGMVADIVRNVAGDRATVTNLIGEGVDPHLYSASGSDVKQLRDADVVFYSGLMLEGKMGDVLVQVARGGRRVYAVTELIDPSYLLEPPSLGGHPDPHVWMDPAAWSKAVDVVADKLAEYDPANAETYARNAAAYRAELAKLDDYARRNIATIPKPSRVMITAHDAFNYFGRAYDLEVEGIQGISTQSDAGIRDINRLVDLIVDRDIKAVFVESSVPAKNVRALIEGAASRGKTVEIGGMLFSDAMGSPGTYEGTYVGMIDHNVTVVARALGGDAPERGMNGKLSHVE